MIKKIRLIDLTVGDTISFQLLNKTYYEGKLLAIQGDSFILDTWGRFAFDNVDLENMFYLWESQSATA